MISQSNSVVFEVVDDRAVLVDPSGSELITLNPVGSLIWEALAEPTDAESITERLLPKFEDVTRDELHADIIAFIEELTELGLLTAEADA